MLLCPEAFLIWIQSSIVVDYYAWHIVEVPYIFNTHDWTIRDSLSRPVGMNLRFGERGRNTGEKEEIGKISTLSLLDFCLELMFSEDTPSGLT